MKIVFIFLSEAFLKKFQEKDLDVIFENIPLSFFELNQEKDMNNLIHIIFL
jgi:hypothetical protein